MDLPRRVMLIGLDALDHRKLRQWMNEGSLPNMAKFAERSISLAVASDGELLHGSVWPTFASGWTPGHHGIYWWTQWLAEEARYVRNSHGAFDFDPFWRQAALAGKRSIIVDVPYVRAVRDGHTWTAVGWGLHDEMEPVSYPEPFLPAIRRRYGDHPLRMDTMHSMDPRAKRRMAADMARGVAMRARLVADLAGRRDWEFFFVTFSETHKAGHYLAADEDLGEGMTNDDAIRSIVEPFDRAFPEIVERAGEDTDIAILALHGMEPQVEWSAVAPQFAALVDDRSLEAATPSPDLVRRIRNLLPPQLQQAIWYLFPPSLRQRRFAQTVTQGLTGDERLFHVSHDGALALRLNLAEREKNGSVSAEEGQRLLTRAAELASQMETDGAERAFEPLLRSAQRFPGPRSHRLPDAFVPLNPAVERVEWLAASDGRRVGNPAHEARNGVHTSEGFCFYWPAAPVEAQRSAVSSLDFAPSILQRLGLSAPESLEGEPFFA
ncbi:MAG TPA: alkaline phosphatase family protein [Tepidiformaceae bacterium]|nr:alkaline phosphatase family protein [Tepidiformaceae bacterium]